MNQKPTTTINKLVHVVDVGPLKKPPIFSQVMGQRTTNFLVVKEGGSFGFSCVKRGEYASSHFSEVSGGLPAFLESILHKIEPFCHVHHKMSKFALVNAIDRVSSTNHGVCVVHVNNDQSLIKHLSKDVDTEKAILVPNPSIKSPKHLVVSPLDPPILVHSYQNKWFSVFVFDPQLNIYVIRGHE